MNHPLTNGKSNQAEPGKALVQLVIGAFQMRAFVRRFGDGLPLHRAKSWQLFSHQ